MQFYYKLVQFYSLIEYKMISKRSFKAKMLKFYVYLSRAIQNFVLRTKLSLYLQASQPVQTFHDLYDVSIM